MSDKIFAVLIFIASLAVLVIHPLWATPDEPADDEPEHTTQDAQTTAGGPDARWW